MCFKQTNTHLLLQHWRNDQLGSEQGKVLQGLGSIQTAGFAKHGKKDGLLHALDKVCDVLLTEMVAFRNRGQPRWRPVTFSMQTFHNAGR